jgi:hypothetical protein
MESTMERFGSNGNDMRENNHYDTFLGRIKLLVIMLKAFLGDYPLQGIRLKAIARNAVEVTKICEDWNQYSIQVRPTSGLNEGFELDHILYQRISLLAIMAKSVVLGNPMGHHREKIIRDNISYIVDVFQFNPQEEFSSFLKVA